MAFGIIEYNEDGLPKCEVCGLFFKRVIPHARQKHSLTEKEYKKQFGFDVKKGICSKESSAKTREKTLENYDKCIKNNLEIKGEKSRFVPGAFGRIKEQVSAQSKIRLKQRLKEPYMIEAMKKAGEMVGKSGLGNKARWGKKINIMSSLKKALTQLPEPTKTIGEILIEFYDTMKGLEKNVAECGGKQAVKIVMTISDIEKLIVPAKDVVSVNETAKNYHLQNALLDAANWQKKLLNAEIRNLPFEQAKEKVLDEIYDKYADKIFQHTVPTTIEQIKP